VVLVCVGVCAVWCVWGRVSMSVCVVVWCGVSGVGVCVRCGLVGRCVCECVWGVIGRCVCECVWCGVVWFGVVYGVCVRGVCVYGYVTVSRLVCVGTRRCVCVCIEVVVCVYVWGVLGILTCSPQPHNGAATRSSYHCRPTGCRPTGGRPSGCHRLHQRRAQDSVPRFGFYPRGEIVGNWHM